MVVNKVPHRSTEKKMNIGTNKLMEKSKKVIVVVLVVFVVVILMSVAAASLALVTTVWQVCLCTSISIIRSFRQSCLS